MPPVNWDAFAQLPGAAEDNFEMLCRALVRRHYGQYGDFAARAAQPGVEFHLKLYTACDLGEPGRWYGWQCRWYDLPSGRALGSRRRAKIREAIATTERELPGLTDWVLWTRHPLTAGDQRWFYKLQTRMRLVLWTAAEVEEHLSGDAEILRGTYFGELVLTPNSLADLHAEAVAPIRRRWQPQVHQVVDAERMLRRMLGGTEPWDDLQDLADQLATEADRVGADLGDPAEPLANATVQAAEVARVASDRLAEAHGALQRGDLDLLRQQLATGLAPLSPELVALPRGLRALRRRAALSVTNALADVRVARELLAEVDAHLGARLVAVVADAGCGKTELAAQLTAADKDRPAGVLLHGRNLQAGQNLDDLTRKIVLHGMPVASMEALLAAVDAAGQRARRRLPVVIDGLNEADDPRDWKAPLASLLEVLRRYPYAVVVCTVRSSFADEALPDDVDRLKIPDFGHDTREAIGRYFAYYRIDPADAELPLGLLEHPLTLRLFCEVTNPDRAHVVGIEAIPRSLSAIFDRYLAQAAQRIAELAPRSRRYYELDIRGALEEIGVALWEQGTRDLDRRDLRQRLGDDARPWNESIVRALEEDGVLLRVPGDAPGAPRVQAVYDPLAGHLIADAALSRHGRAEFAQWLHDPATSAALAGPLPDRHPLASDTFLALVGLLPRRPHRQQLWSLLEEPLRTAALREAADLEGAYLDADTVEQLKALVARPADGLRDLFDRLAHTRGAPAHPLNAEFLDAVLRPMGVAERDLRWTEWVRRHRNDILEDLRRLEEGWRAATQRSPADRLRARWVMWTLTSTVRQLRDQATRTLYWFGRGDSTSLFDLALDALAINDPYVLERLLAAAYGVAMVHQLPSPEFADALKAYLAGLRDCLTGPAATHPTSHWLTRLYAQGTVMLAKTYYPEAVPAGLEASGHMPFTPGPAVDPISDGDPHEAEVDRTLRMDFRNYTLGMLFRGRRNYDMRHAGHIEAVAHVRGTVWVLGWREAELGAVDATLGSNASGHEPARTERYGKKYGWIGFYTYAGRLSDDGRLPADREHLTEVDIDPSFPERPPSAPVAVPIWARPTPAEDRRWIRHGIVTVPDELLRRQDIGPHPGPWIAVHGHLNADDQSPRRRVFGLLMAVLVKDADADRLVDALSARPYPGNDWVPQQPPIDIYTFAGEIPWSPDFARGDPDSGTPAERYRHSITVENEPPVEVEILAHEYEWESYHSALNQAASALIPSRPFSDAFNLRGMPQTFNQTLADGTVAAVSLGGPGGLTGRLLYLRADLVDRYAAGRRLVWFVWGERQLYPFEFPPPAWLARVYDDQAHIWRHVRRGEE